MHGCRTVKDKFWSDPSIRKAITKSRFEYHDPQHRPACFKKTCECRMLFPKLPHDQTTIVEDNSEGVTAFTRLVEGDTLFSKPWLLYPKRPMGCEYINQHSHAVSEVFNCNSNIQIGDPSHVFYSTLYTSKSTQDDDSNRQKRIAMSIVRRLIRQEKNAMSGHIERIPEGFIEGISRMLSGLCAATCRDSVSAPMAHLLICQNGKRFRYSHDFAPMLVNQMDDALAGRPVKSILRKTRERGKKKDGGGREIMWLDSLSNDYLYRPRTQEFKNMSLYEFTMHYEKQFKSHDMTIRDGTFSQEHPGRPYVSCQRREHPVIPRVSYVKDSMCMIQDLEMNKLPGKPTRIRERYAKTALLQFYPYRNVDDLMCKGSYWKRFMCELTKKRRGIRTKFWDQGFEILQNVDDRLTMQRNGKRPTDEVDKDTVCQDGFETGKKKRKRYQDEDEDGLMEISDED